MRTPFRLPAILCLILGMAAPVVLLRAQTYINKEWTRTAGQPGEVRWTANTLDWEGNLIVVGNTLASPGVSHVLITKYGPGGDTLWQRTYAGSDALHDHGIAVTTDASGNVFVAATVNNTGNDLDFALIKYDTDGEPVWDATWNGPSDREDVPAGLAFDGNDDIYLFGASWTSPDFTDLALVKFNAAGGLEWSATYDHAGLIDAAIGLMFDGQDNPMVTGPSAAGIMTWDMAMLTYDAATGDGLDTIRTNLPGIGFHKASALVIDDAGNLLFTGSFQNGPDMDIQTLKLGPDLSLGWGQVFEGEGHDDQGLAVAADPAGNVYVCGTQGNDSGGSDFITLKYDPEGELLWARTHQPKEDTLFAVATKLAVHGEGVVVTGAVSNGETLDFVTVKYDAEGNLEWTQEHGAVQTNDQALALAVGSGGVIYVSGLSGEPLDWTYATVKYDVYQKDNPAVLDSLDNPLYQANEVIVRFRSHLVDTTFVDSRDRQHTTLGRLLPDSVRQAITDKFGMPAGTFDRMKVVKVFRQFTRADSISISRLGEEVRMPRCWSTFLITDGSIGTDVQEIADSLSTLGDHVDYAEPNLLFSLFDVPNDPYYNDFQRSLHDPVAGIDAEAAWDIETGSWDIKVGVVDALIHWQHLEFGDGTQAGTKVTAGKDYGDNGNTIFDFFAPPTDHGTACAGIIAAERHNNTGIAGLAGGHMNGQGNRGVQLVTLGITASPTVDPIPVSGIAEAIMEGAAEISGGPGFGCHVLNNSYGWYVNNISYEDAVALHRAVQAAYRNHCVFVAARGNGGYAPSFDPTEPALPACLTPERMVLNVGGSDEDGAHWDALSYGGGVDLVAPGHSALVASTSVPSIYTYFQLSSAAAPHASGVAALMLSQHRPVNGAPNGLAPEDVEEIIERTATDVGDPGYDEYNGHGRLNAGAALQAVAHPYAVVHSGVPAAPPAISAPTNQPIELAPHNPWDLNPGLYDADRIEVTHTYHDELPPGTTILGHWLRESSTTGTAGDPIVIGVPWADATFTIDGSTAEVTVVTYCWRIYDVVVGGVLLASAYFPAPPEGLVTAYSLHVQYETSVAVADAPRPAGITLHPNPAEDVLYIGLGGLEGTGWQLDILDALGRSVHTRTGLGAGQPRLALPTSHLAQGSYCVRLHNGARSHTVRFIKQ